MRARENIDTFYLLVEWNASDPLCLQPWLFYWDSILFIIGVIICTLCPSSYSMRYARHLLKLNEAMQNWAASWQSQQCCCAPSLIKVFAVRMKKALVLSYPLSAQWRLWSDWEDAQADLSLRWAYAHFVGFVTRRLNYSLSWIGIYLAKLTIGCTSELIIRLFIGN